MSSSEDDTPLVKSKLNGVKSDIHVPKNTDTAKNGTSAVNGHLDPGVSVRMGPVEEIDMEQPQTNGISANDNAPNKRKARSSVNKTKSYKDDTSSEDDEVPLKKRRKTTPHSDDEDEVPLATKKIKKPPKITAAQVGEDSDSDEPLGKKLAKEKAAIEKAAEKQAKSIRANEQKLNRKTKRADSDDEDEPLAKKRKSAGGKSKAAKQKESDEDKPLAKKAPAAKKSKVKAETPSPMKKAKGKAKAVSEEPPEDDPEAEEEDEEYRWWEDPTKGDGTIKWTTLQHNGVVFPPPYEPLPKRVKMRYDGVPVNLHPEAEEVAGFFGSMLNSTHNVENPTFQTNFFHDFKEILDKTGHATDNKGNKIKIKEFAKCDFNPIYECYDAERAKKKSLPAAEKKAIKAAKDAAEAPYQYCIWDGRKQKVGNFRVEPPALFRGRGEHPKTGKVKKRVMPEQITINIGKEATVPAPPEGQNWKEIKHDQEGTWLAMWQENINGAHKYVMLAANSDVKGQSDYKKFEKARELKKYIDKIRRDYTKDLKAELMADRQRATAIYLIDQFALRAGNEKGEDEADTVGCCSLKYEHITMKPPNTVVFDFLGKDSIRFYDEVQVDPQVFKNLKLFKKPPKEDGDDVFDRLTTSALNKHLSNYMPGLTAKVFRTYNASWTMARLLKDMKSEGTIPEKVRDYNEANRKVAILCNHKRTVAAGHAGQMEKMADKINGMKYQQWRIQQMMLALEPKLKKKKGAEWFELPEELTKDWIKEHQKQLVEEQRQKIRKKFDKENEKRTQEGEKEMKAKELEERLEAADELDAKFKQEIKTGKVVPEGKGPTVEKFEQALEKFDERIATAKVQSEDKENLKEVALGTSKINYIDPRLTVVFSKKFGVPIERFFSKTLREKFEWAIKSVDEDWEF